MAKVKTGTKIQEYHTKEIKSVNTNLKTARQIEIVFVYSPYQEKENMEEVAECSEFHKVVLIRENNSTFGIFSQNVSTGGGKAIIGNLAYKTHVSLNALSGHFNGGFVSSRSICDTSVTSLHLCLLADNVAGGKQRLSGIVKTGTFATGCIVSLKVFDESIRKLRHTKRIRWIPNISKTNAKFKKNTDRPLMISFTQEMPGKWYDDCKTSHMFSKSYYKADYYKTGDLQVLMSNLNDIVACKNPQLFSNLEASHVELSGLAGYPFIFIL